MHGNAAYCNWILSLWRPNSGIGPDSKHCRNKTRVELVFATVALVLRTLGIGVFTLPRAQPLGFDASFLNAMSVRIAVVFLQISFKNKSQTCFVSRRTSHDVFESIQTL